jgi:hypothetical protein
MSALPQRGDVAHVRVLLRKLVVPVSKSLMMRKSDLSEVNSQEENVVQKSLEKNECTPTAGRDGPCTGSAQRTCSRWKQKAQRSKTHRLFRDQNTSAKCFRRNLWLRESPLNGRDNECRATAGRGGPCSENLQSLEAKAAHLKSRKEVNVREGPFRWMNKVLKEGKRAQRVPGTELLPLLAAGYGGPCTYSAPQTCSS